MWLVVEFEVVSPWAFPCQHDNVNERERKDISGTQSDDVTMTSKQFIWVVVECVCHMESKLGIPNVKNKIAEKELSMEQFDPLRHKMKKMCQPKHMVDN